MIVHLNRNISSLLYVMTETDPVLETKCFRNSVWWELAIQ
jgi:hypothetical protein